LQKTKKSEVTLDLAGRDQILNRAPASSHDADATDLDRVAGASAPKAMLSGRAGNSFVEAVAE
jgi:hypothetical protein